MIIYEYANEAHIVKEFINYTLHNPVTVSSDLALNFFVWAYEMWLPEGGKQGYSGSIDLIASDEMGNVWLIEAKQSANPELCAGLWSNQILNYRWALARRNHAEISMKSRRFILGNGSIDILPDGVKNSNSLFDAFKKWSLGLNKDTEFARTIYNRTIQNIKDENVISTVLADVYRLDVWNGRPKDNKPYAYIATEGTGDEFQLNVILDAGKGIGILDELDYTTLVLDWAEISKEKRKVKPAPDTVEVYLTNKVSEIYRSCLKNLAKVGWNGKFKSNQKAYVVDLPTIYGADIRIHLGWVDFDASFSIKNKLPGELGLKFNIDFRHFKNSGDPGLFNTGYKLARQLAKRANYNGRGKGLYIQERELTTLEKESWDWEMYRRKDKENRDYLGRYDEEKDFEAAWDFLREIVG